MSDCTISEPDHSIPNPATTRSQTSYICICMHLLLHSLMESACIQNPFLVCKMSYFQTRGGAHTIHPTIFWHFTFWLNIAKKWPDIKVYQYKKNWKSVRPCNYHKQILASYFYDMYGHRIASAQCQMVVLNLLCSSYAPEWKGTIV